MYCNSDKRKCVIVGVGAVGGSFAYALVGAGLCNELVLIDIDKKRAAGEAMDLGHSLAFAPSPMNIYAGGWEDCADADIVAVCAGAAQKPGESRMDLAKRNIAVFADIIPRICDSGFAGILLVATNPVDLMTRAAAELSGHPWHRVIGTGTTLDTARLRYLLGRYFSIDPRNVHAYVIGEHGDSELVPWSQAMVATKPVSAILAENTGRFFDGDLDRIANDVRGAAYKIIEAKGSTQYGIGMAMTRIARAVWNDESSVLTVSAMLEGEYSQEDIYTGTPCVIGREGVISKVRLRLAENEERAFAASCDFLRRCFRETGIDMLSR